jgi:fructose/tagatose bisphosphate aldolase
LHGGSGLTDEQYRSAIKSGIAKINIFTNLAVTAGEQIAAVAKTEYSSYWAFNGSAKTAFQERCKHYIEVFGSAGKG